ncbi:MAG: hypothetical protein IKX87_12760 [Lachnospiraceae bacterium]|nr:hypothetical protein [Lachnospiraceae bacterium]
MGRRILAVLLSMVLFLTIFIKSDAINVYAGEGDGYVEAETEVETVAEETTVSEETVISAEAEETEEVIEEVSETETPEVTPEESDASEATTDVSASDIEETEATVGGDVTEAVDVSGNSETVSGNDSPVSLTEDISDNDVTDVAESAVESTESEALVCVRQIGGVSITVEAPAGVFPAGTTVSVTELTDAGSINSIEDAVSDKFSDNQTITVLRAFDITMYDANGQEIQPDTTKGSVKVSITNINTDEAIQNPDTAIEVFHMDDALNRADAVATTVAKGEVSFAAEHFSPYVVVSVEDNEAEPDQPLDENALIESMKVSIVDSKGKETVLTDGADLKVSLDDTIKVSYVFNHPIQIVPVGGKVNNKVDGYHVRVGQHYKVPGIPAICVKPGGFSIDVKNGEETLGQIHFAEDGSATLEIDSRFTEPESAEGAVAGFDLKLNLNKDDNGDKEDYELTFGDKTYTVKVSEFMPQPPKVEKSSSTMDSDGNITWTVTLTNDEKPIDYADGYTLTDTFSAGQAYLEGSLEEVGGAAITPTVSGSTIKWTYKDNTPSKVTKFTYKTHIDFLALTKDTNEGNTTVNKEVTNNIKVTAPAGTDYDALSISATSGSSVSKNVDKWVDKTGTQVDSTGKASWTIVVKNNGFTLKNVVLHDDIVADDGVTIEMSNIKVVDAHGNTVAFDDGHSGGNHTIAFDGLMEGDAVYTVTYDTTIKNYSEYLKKNHEVPKNTAWLTYEYDATGKGTDWTPVKGPGVDVNFTGPGIMSKAAIKKSPAGIDRVNHTMDWRVEINNNMQALTNVRVVDAIPAGHTYVGIKNVTVDGSAFTLADDAIDVTDPRNIMVSFGDNVEGVKASFVITTKLTDEESKIWASNASKDYTNEVTLYSEGNAEVKDSATQKFKSEVISKAAGDYDYSTHLIPYTLTVNQNKMPMDNVVITDPLDSRVEYVDGSSNVAGTVYDAHTNTLTFNLGSIDAETVITFKVKVKDGETFANNAKFSIPNNASLKSAQYNNNTSVSASTEIDNKVINKKGKRNKEVIEYTVDLNVAEQELYKNGIGEVVIQDTMGASLVLDESTVKLYEATVKSDGTLVPETLVPDAVVRVDKSNPQTVLQVVIPKNGDGKAYVLQYTALMLKAKAKDFSNNVVIKGYGDGAINKSDVQYEEKDFSNVNFSKYVYYISGLKDENDNSLILAGAHFQLLDPEEDYKIVDEADSDEDGEIMFVGVLKENHEYLLKETDAPEGYEIPITLKDGVVVKTKGKGYNAAMEEKDNQIVYNSKPSREVNFALLNGTDKTTDLTGLSDTPAKITVYKGATEVWNSDSTEPFKAIYGTEYTVKESTTPFGYHGDSASGYKFTIKEDTGELVLLTSSDDVKLSGDNITMYDTAKESMSIMINDISESQGRALKGAKFQVKQGSTVVKSFESEGLFKEITLPEGDYTLTRVDAPFGFEAESKALSFAIKKNAEGALEIETSSNIGNITVEGNKIVVPEVSKPADSVTVDPVVASGSDPAKEADLDFVLTPRKYADGSAVGLSDTPAWSKSEGTPMKLLPQVEYDLTVIDKNGKKVSKIVMIDEKGNLVVKDYPAPKPNPGGGKSWSYSAPASTKSVDVLADEYTAAGKKLAKTGGFMGTVAGYGAGFALMAAGLFMVRGKKKKNK